MWRHSMASEAMLLLKLESMLARPKLHAQFTGYPIECFIFC